MVVISICKSHPTTVCPRLLTSRFIKVTLPTNIPVIEVGLADLATGEAEGVEQL